MLPDSSFLLVNANETSIARGQKALDHSILVYGNYNVPYYKAADQCIRLSLKLLERFSWTKQNLNFVVSYRANVAFISIKS